MTTPSKQPSEWEHTGQTCEEAHGGELHLDWAIKRRRKRRARAAIGLGLVMIVVGIAIGAIINNETLAWALALPGLFVLMIGGRPVRYSVDNVNDRDGRESDR